MKPHYINRLGKGIALLSFLIGTCLLGSYYFTSSSEILILSFYFIPIAIIVNMVILGLLLSKSRKDDINRQVYLSTSKFLLCNIPIAVIYLSFVFILLDNMRVTFINKTGKPIEQIEISGCEVEKIDKLEIDEKKTIWIAIPRDCSVDIKYSIDGRMENEKVFEYITTMMGQQTTFRIGSNESPIF